MWAASFAARSRAAVQHLGICRPTWICTRYILSRVPIPVLIPGHDWSIIDDGRVGTRLLLLAALDEVPDNTCNGLADDDNYDNLAPDEGGGRIKPATVVAICAMSSWENLSSPADEDSSTVDVDVVGELEPVLVSSISHIRNKHRQNCLLQC